MGVLKYKGKDIIMVIMDRFTKYSHFIALSHSFLVKMATEIFLNHFYKFHWLSVTIVTDRDIMFTSLFWNDLFMLLGVELFMSSTTIQNLMGN